MYSVDQWWGFRFPGIGLAAGDTVTASYLQFWMYAFFTVRSTITGDDADNAAVFASTSNNISGRTDTTASVSWSADLSGAGLKSSPSLNGIIDEIKARGGWASGNALAYLLTWATGGDFNCYFYDANDGAEKYPRIHIEYTEGGGVSAVLPFRSLLGVGK